MLTVAPEFKKNKFYAKTKQYNDPSFPMLTDKLFAEMEQEAFASFKAIMPRLVSTAIENAMKQPGSTVDWLETVEKDPTV